MKKEFVEMVVSAPFILVKGFLMGLIEGIGESPVYFFSRRTGIRVETLSDAVKEWLGFENLVHLCVEKDFSERLNTAMVNTHDRLGMEVKSVRKIESAGFEFDAHLYVKDQADEFQALLDNLPKGVYLDEFKEDEFQDPNNDGEVGAYAPNHAYEYKGRGRIVGDFGGVVATYIKLKNDPLIRTEEVGLNFPAS